MTKTLIIAEAGVNHNGDINLAYKLIDVAKEAGVDIVKFQTFVPHLLTSTIAQKAQYQKGSETDSESQFDMINKLALKASDFKLLNAYCEQIDIKFLSTPFDLVSIDTLVDLGIEIFKIPSGEITNLPYLRKIGALKKDIIFSTGMSTSEEIEDALKILEDAGTPRRQITILHCNTEYPTPFVDVNLKAMNWIANKFNVRVGYSDHTLGIEVPIAAVTLGASVIEKHFTLDKTMEGPDHAASLEPNELKQMVKSIRNIEQALGNEQKIISPSEQKNRVIARKSIHLAIKLSKEEIITAEHLIMKRPGNGISPMELDKVIGKRSKDNFQEDYQIQWEDIE